MLLEEVSVCLAAWHSSRALAELALVGAHLRRRALGARRHPPAAVSIYLDQLHRVPRAVIVAPQISCQLVGARAWHLGQDVGLGPCWVALAVEVELEDAHVFARVEHELHTSVKRSIIERDLRALHPQVGAPRHEMLHLPRVREPDVVRRRRLWRRRLCVGVGLCEDSHHEG